MCDEVVKLNTIANDMCVGHCECPMYLRHNSFR